MDAWQEAVDFGARNENAIASPPNNNNQPSGPYYDASTSGNLNSVAGGPLTSGTGYVANGSDSDFYQFAINSTHVNNVSCTNMLRLRLTAPRTSATACSSGNTTA